MWNLLFFACAVFFVIFFFFFFPSYFSSAPHLRSCEHFFFLLESRQYPILISFFTFLAFGQILSGPFSDKYGRKPILLLGASIYSVSAFFASLSSNIEILLILRCFQGFGAAACLSVGRTILSDCYEIKEAAKEMSKMTAIMAVIPISCFIFGGFLAEFLGWRTNLIALALILKFLKF